MRGQFTAAQREVLLRPIMANRIATDGKGFAHIESYEVEAHLDRIFGFEGWDKFLPDVTLIFEDITKMKSGKDGWNVCYRATVRLEAYSPDGGLAKVSEDASTGEATQPSRADAHDLALKSAVSVALKRAAKGLGDQFGLSLYDHGSTDPLVKKVVPYGSPAPAPATPVQREPEPSPHLPPGINRVDDINAPRDPQFVETAIPPDAPMANRGQQTKLRAALHGVSINDNDDVHQWCSAKLKRPVESLSLITAEEISRLIDEVGK